METKEDNQELMTRYLLGEASEQEQTRVEEQYFHDPDFYLEMLVVEDELICDYERDRLPPRERELFEQYFLASSRRRRKYETTKELINLAASAPPHDDASPARDRLSWFESLRLRALIPGFAVAALALALIGGTVWLAVENSRLREQLRQSEAEQAALRQQAQGQERQIADARARNNQLAADVEDVRRQLESIKANQTPAQQPAPGLVSFILTSLVRDPQAARPLVIPAQAETVRLRLYFTGQLYPAYRAVIRTVSGEEVWSRSGLNGRAIKSGGEVVLNLPATLFAKRDYLLSLDGLTAAGGIDNVSQYYFRVDKK
ncbi:MAG TPA: hypothetical protein VFD58_10910 [Blastocatellia bacterium]|nr:hypothetical protein [Blastocatellia bacterium]